jgi:hypothetical protein
VRPVLAWGLGWSAGLFLIALYFWAIVMDHGWPQYPLLLSAGFAALGWPMYISARDQRSARPRTEAILWVIGFVVLVSVLTEYQPAAARLASPGEVNVNTTESMQRREWYFHTFHRSPEQIGQIVFVFAAISMFGAGCGLASGAAATWSWAGRKKFMHSIAFGAATSAAVLTATVAMFAAISIVPFILALSMRSVSGRLGFLAGLLVSGFLGGVTAGWIIHSARRGLLIR